MSFLGNTSSKNGAAVELIPLGKQVSKDGTAVQVSSLGNTNF
jgi:hypothetical protein